jgi:hypothetical protein
MPGYHYKRKGFYEGGGGGLGIGPGSHSDQGQYGGPGEHGGHHSDPNQGFGPSYGAPDAPGPDSDNGGGLSSLSDIVGLYSKYSPTALAMKSLGFLRDSIEGFFGYEGDPAAPPTGNPNNPEGGGGGDILLAQQPLTNLPMQPMDPDQAYLDDITDPQQVRVIQFMEREGIYSPQQIRQYLDATARNVGLG